MLSQPGSPGSGAPGRDGEHRHDRRALARPGTARVETQGGRALQVEHLDDARPRAPHDEAGAVGRDARLRARRLPEHDVARVVDEALDRVSGGARGRGQRQRQGERHGEPPRHSSGAALSQPTAVTPASASQITALVRHQAQ